MPTLDQKIDSRESLLDAIHVHTDNHEYNTYNASIVFMQLQPNILHYRFANLPHKLVEPHHKDIYDNTNKDNPDFANLPDEFFVDCWKVAANYGHHVRNEPETGLNPTRTAIYNTCINRENFWVFREAARFHQGIYTAPEWLRHLHTNNLHKCSLSLHFPHISLEDPTMVAYTPSHDYGLRDRQVKTKVGKYLTKYYSDVLSQDQIRAFANGAKGFEVLWATDRDGFRHVYANGPSSCMSGSPDEFSDLDGRVHPVDVYDTGEYRLGYIKSITGKIVARGFVHEPSKTWIRVYGDEGTTLADHFQANGYTKTDNWAGNKILRIEDSEGRIVLPYLDGDAKGVIERGTFFYITEFSSKADFWCDFTNGTPDDPNTGTCEVCGGRHHEDDLRWSNYHEMYIGECCIDDYEHAHIGRYDRDWVRASECIYCESDGEWYLQEYAEEKGLICTDNGWFDPDDCVETVDGDYILEDDAVEVGQNKYGSPVYVSRTQFDPVIYVDFASPVTNAYDTGYALYHEEYLPDDYDQDQLIVDDFGTQTGKRFRSLREILAIYGPELTRETLLKTGMNISSHRLRMYYSLYHGRSAAPETL